MSRRTSWTGAFLESSFCWSFRQYSKICVKLMPFFAMNGTDMPQL